MSEPFAVAAMCLSTIGGTKYRMSLHVRLADTEEEAIGQVVKHVQAELDADWHLAQIIASPVYKQNGAKT